MTYQSSKNTDINNRSEHVSLAFMLLQRVVVVCNCIFYSIYIYNLACGRVAELEAGGQLFWISWLQAVKTGFLITAVTAGQGARPRCAESVSIQREKHTQNVICYIYLSSQ